MPYGIMARNHRTPIATASTKSWAAPLPTLFRHVPFRNCCPPNQSNVAVNPPQYTSIQLPRPEIWGDAPIRCVAAPTSDVKAKPRFAQALSTPDIRQKISPRVNFLFSVVAFCESSGDPSEGDRKTSTLFARK